MSTALHPSEQLLAGIRHTVATPCGLGSNTPIIVVSLDTGAIKFGRVVTCDPDSAEHNLTVKFHGENGATEVGKANIGLTGCPGTVWRSWRVTVVDTPANRTALATALGHCPDHSAAWSGKESIAALTAPSTPSPVRITVPKRRHSTQPDRRPGWARVLMGN